MDRDSERGAIGGRDTKFHYNTPAVSVGNQIRDGDEYVLFVRSKQSDGFQAWSSNDATTTPQLVQQAVKQLNLEPTT